MAKDPAMLWYWSDWNSGTVTLMRLHKGAYMDLLHAQFHNGHLSLDEIRAVLGLDFETCWPVLEKKFKIDENGLFFNERLDIEKEKRKNFTESRRKNLTHKVKHKEPHMVPHMDAHMENENRNRNIDDTRIGGTGGKDREWFVSCIDEMYREILIMTHKGKNIDQAISESWAYLSAEKNRLDNANPSDVKKLVNTWLGNMKNGEKQPRKKAFEL